MLPVSKDCLTTREGPWCHLQSTVFFYGTRSYWLGAGMQLISLAGRHWRVISVIGIWLMVKVMACAPSKGRGGSHDLNCPITIVVRLYISGYGDLLYNIMRQSGF